MIRQPFQGRERGGDAIVIRNPSMLQGDIEIHPDENPFAVRLQIPYGFFLHQAGDFKGCQTPGWQAGTRSGNEETAAAAKLPP